MRPHEVECWLFDLDNTLYPADCNLFAQIDVRMGEYISTRLGVDRSEARWIQKAYYFQYGMTLRGLMLEHRIAPRDYLEFVHDIDDSPANLRPAAERGMTTVWVKHGRADLAHGADNPHERYADHITDDLEAWLVAVANDG